MLVLTRSDKSKGTALRLAKAAGRSEVNRRIGEVRVQFITDIPGQQAIYSAKEAEARAYLALDPAPLDLTAFPFLAGEVGLTAPDAAALAALWLAMSDRWRSVGSELEQLRLGVSASVEAAESVVEVSAILAELETYLEAI